MATGGNNFPSLRHEHEEYIDTPCTTCESKGKRTEATCYCEKCEKCFCDSCEVFHKEFTNTRRHTVLRRAQRNQWGIPQLRVYGDECTCNDDHVVTKFCGQHAELCCEDCFSRYHSDCENSTSIQESAPGVSTSIEMKYVRKDIEQVRAEITTANESKKAMLSSLEDFRAEYGKEMKAFKKRINSVINAMERNTDAAMETLYNKNSEQIQADIEKCNTFMQEFQDLETQLAANNDTQMYVAMKHAEEKLLICKEEIYNMTPATAKKLSFSPKETIIDHLTDCKLFGEFQEKVCNDKECLPSNISKEMTIRPDTGKSKCDKEINIRTTIDKHTCDIQGMCQLLDGSVILSDHGNENIKRLDQTYAVVDTCVMSGHPNRVCRIGIREIAVALGKKKVVQCISITDRMRPTSTLRLDHNCYGIAYNRDELYVTNGVDKTFVYDIRNRDRCLPLECLKSNIPTSVTMNSSRSRIIIVGKSIDIVVADLQSNLLPLVSNKTLKGTQKTAKKDICVDDKGNIFVCTEHDRNILLLTDNSDDPSIRPFDTGINSTGALLVDISQSKLLLQRERSDVICFYDICYG